MRPLWVASRGQTPRSLSRQLFKEVQEPKARMNVFLSSGRHCEPPPPGAARLRRLSVSHLMRMTSTGGGSRTITKRINHDPVALTAVRHLEEFGFTGWHLKSSKDFDPSVAGAVAGADERFERQVVQAEQYVVRDLPARDDSAVFLMRGEPRPRIGDGLVALTRYWVIEGVNVIGTAGHEPIYAVLCV